MSSRSRFGTIRQRLLLTDSSETLGQGLADRYRIERELGRGGMAVVYLAHDLKHNRQVALKAIHSDLVMQGAEKRFAREIQVAARLQHPHILTVFDSGESQGQLWFTMPYVKGESLRERLRREKQLPVGEAVRIVREAVLALDHAHRNGVIHRDIKPENILLTEDGSALVADFGIAHAVEPITGAGLLARPSGRAKLTDAGMVVGTPAYMAPEQQAGAGSDARSDIYSLAAVFHELLTGQMVSPDGGGGLDQMLNQMSDMMPHARLVRREVPEALDRVIRQGLNPDPARRFSSMAEFGRAIDDAVTGSWRAATVSSRRRTYLLPGLLVLLAIAGGFWWTRRGVASSELDSSYTLAAGASGRARPTTFPAAYDEFLKGEAAYNSYDASDVWGSAAEGHYSEAVRRDSAFGVAWARLATLFLARRQSGITAANGERDSLERSIRRAKAFAPEAPQTFLARTHYAWYVKDDTAEARRVILAALARYPADAEILALAANAELQRGRWDEALHYARRALAADPRSRVAALATALSELGLGRIKEARRDFSLVAQLNPRDDLARLYIIRTYLAEGDLDGYRRAIRQTPPPLGPDGALALSAGSDQVPWALDGDLQWRLLTLPAESFHMGGGGQRLYLRGLVFLLQGDTAGAKTAMRQALDSLEDAIRELPEAPHLLVWYKSPMLTTLGDTAQAVATLEKGLALRARMRGPRADPLFDYLAARTWLLAGDRARAIASLGAALRLGSFLTPALVRIDPTFETLRGDSAFEALLRN